MFHHYITKYEENEKRYAEAWIQVNILWFSVCFCKRRIEI